MRRTNKKAFTLAELLMALVVVAALAAMVVPGIIDGVNKKILSTQLKSNVTSIQQLIDDQLTANRPVTVTSLADTDFSSPQALFGKLQKTKDECPAGSTDACWLAPGQNPAAYRNLNNMTAPSVSRPTTPSVLLKNGASIAYSVILAEITDNKEKCYGEFWLDVNGPDKPNIIGRDLFTFYVTTKGKIVDSYRCADLTAGRTTPTTKTIEELKTACKGATSADAISSCLTLMESSDWIMNY